MRAWCWTLPVKIIEVNVSVNWVLNLELHFEGFWKGTLSQIQKPSWHGRFFILINMWHLSPGVAGNPGMLPSSGLVRLAWNPKSLSSSAISCGRWRNINSVVFSLFYSNIFLSGRPVQRDRQPEQSPQHNGARRPRVENHRL